MWISDRSAKRQSDSTSIPVGSDGSRWIYLNGWLCAALVLMFFADVQIRCQNVAFRPQKVPDWHAFASSPENKVALHGTL